MAGQYTQTLDEIDRLIADLKEHRGIVIEPLTLAVRELRRHTDSIEKIEANAAAIREEVIDPIKAELNENKRAGRFSIFGFWVERSAWLPLP